jgi:hypothetical protein
MNKQLLLEAVALVAVGLLAGCGGPVATGTVIHVPRASATTTVTDAPEKPEHGEFTANTVTVRLDSGQTVEALASDTQMEEALRGNRSLNQARSFQER